LKKIDLNDSDVAIVDKQNATAVISPSLKKIDLNDSDVTIADKQNATAVISPSLKKIDLNDSDVTIADKQNATAVSKSKSSTIIFKKMSVNELESRLDKHRNKLCDDVLASAEQQLMFLLINYTQESVVAVSNLHNCGITQPGRVCYTSPKTLTKIIFDVKLHPIPLLGIDGREQTLEIAVPINHDKIKSENHDNIVYQFHGSNESKVLSKEEFMERCTKRFRRELHRIANCVAIEKSILYRLPRYIQKRFGIVIKVVKQELEDQKYQHHQEERNREHNKKGNQGVNFMMVVLMRLWFVFAPFVVLLKGVLIYLCILLYKLCIILTCRNDQLKTKEDNIMWRYFIDLRRYYIHENDDKIDTNIHKVERSEDILHADNPNVVALQWYRHRQNQTDLSGSFSL
jgi:hypothetical protein